MSGAGRRIEPPSEDHVESNADAVPAPRVRAVPGASDWCQAGAPVFDGDYVTIRNKAWKGTTVRHNEANREISAEKIPGGDVNVTVMDNKYAFCIRKIIFDTTLKAWILPSLKVRSQREVLSKTDSVIFLCPTSPDYVLGTENPPRLGNNGDYRTKLIKFALVTQNTSLLNKTSERFKSIVSLGLWNSMKNNIDFLAQSRCIWGFHSANGANNETRLLYGSGGLNIRNLWTEVRAKETQIWEGIGIYGPASAISFAIHKTFNGGRNLTQASGSNGAVVKLALSNKDNDDKAVWIVDAWHGNHYPVQRVLIPKEDPPPPPPSPPEGEPPARQAPIPNLTEMIQRPHTNIPAGLSLDLETGTLRQVELEKKTQDQDKRTYLDLILTYLFGEPWDELSFLQQTLIVSTLVLVIVVSAETAVKEII